MGAFKDVRLPEDIGKFYKLEGVQCIHLDIAWQVPHEHSRLVGRSASIYAS